MIRLKLGLLGLAAVLGTEAGVFGVVVVSAEGMKLESTGVRGGFSATDFDDWFYQGEAFVNWDLPWEWEYWENWPIGTQLDFAAGGLTGKGETGFVATLAPALTIGREDSPFSFGVGVGPTVLSREIFGDADFVDFGYPLQFTSYLGVKYDVNSRLALSYRLQHMSNAGLGSRDNPGLNLHSFGIGYRF
jgi:hypothetical protein